MSAALNALSAQSDALNEEVVATMLRNPFWHERFGERAQKHTRQDGAFHLRYLVEALAANSPDVMARYARWLQQVLCSRGMCSIHLADNFRLLGEAISRRRLAEAERAVTYLKAAEQALLYDGGEPLLLQRESARLSAEVATALYRAHPEWLAKWGREGKLRCEDDVRYHVAYLADALALDAPRLFVDYTSWMASFLERRAVVRTHLLECLQDLRARVQRLDGAQKAAAFLGQAVAAL